MPVKVLLQGSEDFSGMGECKRSPSRDRNTFRHVGGKNKQQQGHHAATTCERTPATTGPTTAETPAKAWGPATAWTRARACSPVTVGPTDEETPSIAWVPATADRPTIETVKM